MSGKIGWAIFIASGLFALRCGATVYHSDGTASNVQALHNSALDGDTRNYLLLLLAGGAQAFQNPGAKGEAPSLSQQLVLYRYAVLICQHASAIATIAGSGMVLPAGF